MRHKWTPRISPGRPRICRIGFPHFPHSTACFVVSSDCSAPSSRRAAPRRISPVNSSRISPLPPPGPLLFESIRESTPSAKNQHFLLEGSSWLRWRGGSLRGAAAGVRSSGAPPRPSPYRSPRTPPSRLAGHLSHLSFSPPYPCAHPHTTASAFSSPLTTSRTPFQNTPAEPWLSFISRSLGEELRLIQAWAGELEMFGVERIAKIPLVKTKHAKISLVKTNLPK